LDVESFDLNQLVLNLLPYLFILSAIAFKGIEI